MISKEKKTSEKVRRGLTITKDLGDIDRDRGVIEGATVESKFDDGKLYRGEIYQVFRKSSGAVIKVGIVYNDGDEEITKWPDFDIRIIEGGEDGSELDDDDGVEEEEEEETIVVGARVEVKFGKKWYKVQVTSITFSKKGQIDELKIKYEDGSEELCKYPDSNIRLLGGDDSEVKINHNKRSRDDDNDDEEEDDDDDDEIVKGIVVEVKFGSRWYKGEVFEIKRNKKGRVEEVRIRYKDGSEEKCELPDANIRVFRG